MGKSAKQAVYDQFKIILLWDLGKKNTYFSNITRSSIQLSDADFFWIIPWQYKQSFFKYVFLQHFLTKIAKQSSGDFSGESF